MNKTQMISAKSGDTTKEMLRVAEKESLSPEFIREETAEGRIVIPANKKHTKLDPIGIGKSLRTKINANIGKSPLKSCQNEEFLKLDTVLRYGADTVMDLSTGDNIPEIRAKIIETSPIPLGTVPIYEALSRVDDPLKLSKKLLFDVVREQADQGVDYMTIHAGLLKKHLPSTKKRILPIVSRGGAILAKWMTVHDSENPFYDAFDELLEICLEQDVTLSLGDGLRPGCLADASDDAQFGELKTIGELVRRCRRAGVQAMVEGPGHVPMDEIEMNMRMEDEICEGAPFYVLGPVVSDCSPGYDHITSAIGGALGAMHGAAMLCYVTPKEHLGLPGPEDVRNGIIAFRIAAHAADVALKRPGARDRDDAISRARAAFDWKKQFELALDPDRAKEWREYSPDVENENFCSMCGEEFCSMKISSDL